MKGFSFDQGVRMNFPVLLIVSRLTLYIAIDTLVHMVKVVG